MLLGALALCLMPSPEALGPPKVIESDALPGSFVTQLTSRREAVAALLSSFHVSLVRWLSEAGRAPATLPCVINMLKAFPEDLRLGLRI